MKLSELTANDLAAYLRLELGEGESDPMLESIMPAARSFVLSYTGMGAEEADTHPELVLAALAVGADLYEHRTMQVDNDNINLTAKALMELFSSNLI